MPPASFLRSALIPKEPIRSSCYLSALLPPLFPLNACRGERCGGLGAAPAPLLTLFFTHEFFYRAGKCSYYTTWCPKTTSLQTLVNVAGARWRIEESFETAKNEFGLDHNETRSWHGWHRHVSLVMLAFSLLAIIRYRVNNSTLHKKSRTKLPPSTSLWFAGLSRKFDALLHV